MGNETQVLIGYTITVAEAPISHRISINLVFASELVPRVNKLFEPARVQLEGKVGLVVGKLELNVFVFIKVFFAGNVVLVRGLVVRLRDGFDVEEGVPTGRTCSVL